MLNVDAAHRRLGIGTRLVATLGARARSHGGAALYVSATPTRRTVDFYRGLGAQLLACPDPVLLEKEPADVHLILWLDAGFARRTHGP
jgi:GNAT superfamily N-acetyltransferase